MRTALLLLLLVSCTVTPPGPTVVIHLVEPSVWTSSDREYIAAVAEAWDPLGMDWRLTNDPHRSQNLCPRDWYARNLVDCEIDVGLYRQDGLTARTGNTGESNRATDETWVDSLVVGPYLRFVVAHEIGHHVLDTWEHIDTPGIMEVAGSGVFWRATAADLALACQHIRRGC